MFQEHYAAWYDVMYSQKDYAGEAAAFATLFAQADGAVHKILTLGCGTLRHEIEWAAQGYEITGVDQSTAMLKLAKDRLTAAGIKNISLVAGDMRTFTPAAGAYDVVVAPFNVVSYCTGTAELQAVAERAALALRPGGVFIFDCWYAPAVRQDPPRDRFVKLKQNDSTLYRFVRAQPDLEKQAIDLEIELLQITGDRVTGQSTETHQVHFWELNDIVQVFAAAGLTLVHQSQFPQLTVAPTARRWDMVVVGKK